MSLTLYWGPGVRPIMAYTQTFRTKGVTLSGSVRVSLVEVYERVGKSLIRPVKGP